MVFISLSDTIVRIIAAIIIVLLGLVIGKFFGKVIQKTLKEIGIKLHSKAFISLGIEYVIYLAAIILALNQLGIIKITIYVLLILILIVVLAFAILALKDFIPNFIARNIIRKKGKVKIGDKIKIKNLEGKILSINLIETKVETKNKDVVCIPNSSLLKK